MKTTSTTEQSPLKMKAIVQTEYGSPDVLKLAEVDRPALSDSGVLVRVRATAVHAGDWHLMRGEPFFVRLIYGGVRSPKIKILGTDMAGEVEAVGKAVTQFKPGDQIFGDLSEVGFGAFAEYVCVPEAALVLKPTNLTFEEAATIPVSALTALQGLRDIGQIQAGQKVLVKGASGGVGSFAVQIAKAFGAEVTGVCSPSKAKMVQEIGADHVLDYPQAKAGLKKQYDLLFDVAAYGSVFDDLPLLKPKGHYVCVGGSIARLFQVMLFGFGISKISDRRVKSLAQKPTQADLIVLKELIEAGKIRPYVDRCYSLSEIPTAIRAIEQRQVQGKIAISVTDC
ncbi:NAD(P)-dependent alcohol dehydrogenase [Leptolyngbya sp. AN03gr2]|uniref:NAD(P)-dependent alcohol dehydrogenase n=1 Tax=unclassified Leptolyngbya TaxID=2650499 RepID=UPI003D31512E